MPVPGGAHGDYVMSDSNGIVDIAAITPTLTNHGPGLVGINERVGVYVYEVDPGNDIPDEKVYSSNAPFVSNLLEGTAALSNDNPAHK